MESLARKASALLVVALGAGGLACNSLDNRLKTCNDVRVDLVNGLPSEGPVHIAQEGEALSNDVTLLPAVSGSTRRISACLERGDRLRFRAAYGNVVVATATCVVSHSTEELESLTFRVVWSNQGLLCEGW